MEGRWQWMADWCKSKGLAPHKKEIWKLAGEEYEKMLIKNVNMIPKQIP